MKNCYGEEQPDRPVIVILSGGVGASGEQLAHTVLAQFPESNVCVETVGNIRQPEQITRVLLEAKQKGGFIIHSLVESHLRDYAVKQAQELGVPASDIVGPLITWLSTALTQEPLQQPGKYRQLNRDYFDRVDAIDFMLAHDDGKNPAGWAQAEIVLVGVSRSGKTPLCAYLAVLGWKVANIPLVPEIAQPQAFFELDPKRVFGLTIAPEQLLVYRRQRQARLGVKESSNYTDLETISDELKYARKMYMKGNFQTINMTDKTIEMGADEIIRKLLDQTGETS